jgi:hypothetical protein
MGGILRVSLVLLALTACGEDKAPKPKTDAATDSHPVKNVDSLPSGTIQEGARTMNKGADMGGSLDQQKQERDKEVESQSR